MSMRTTERYCGLLNAGMLAAAGFLGACGAADGDATRDPGAEQVGTTEEAVDADGDTPACAVVEMPDTSDFVLAVNTNHELMMATVQPGATSATWTRVDTGVQGVPTLARFDDGTLDAYVRGTDDKLWEYWWPAGAAGFSILAVRDERAGGQVTAKGSPVVVEVGYPTDYGVSVAVRGLNDSLSTWDWPVTYSYRVVCVGCDPNPITVTNGWYSNSVANTTTTNSISGISVRIDSSKPNPIFGVRNGVNNDVGWFATRTAKAWGKPYNYLVQSSSTGGGSAIFSGVSGTPTPTHTQTAWANFGTDIRHQDNIYTRTWYTMFECYAGGSISESGYFRDSYGRLGRVLLNTGGTCLNEGEILTSKPTMSINSVTQFVYFKGKSGTLHAHKAGTSSGFGMGLAVGK
jgi:hypothetical protein